MKTNITQQNTSMEPDEVSVILVRHAQSHWNRENRFTGWADPPLTAAGVAEAERAGEALQLQGFRFDVAYSSRLQRAVRTLDILLDRLGQSTLPQHRDWRLNERHYGALQGVNKAEAAVRVGEQQVRRWRRGYTDCAPPLPRTDPSHPVNDPLYADVDPRRLPDVENLATTRTRVVAFWQEQIDPRLRAGERILISAHGNTLRALLMELDAMNVEEVEGFEIPTAMPILCRFDRHGRLLSWGCQDTKTDSRLSA